jgi:hypothetical protein
VALGRDFKTIYGSDVTLAFVFHHHLIKQPISVYILIILLLLLRLIWPRMAPSVEVEEQNGDVKEKDDDDVVTPWTVSTSSAAGVDYNKLIEKFGCRHLTQDLVQRIEAITGKRAHVMLRRGLYFAQR